MASGSGFWVPATRMLLGVTGGTPTQKLANTLLGHPLGEWVAIRRLLGHSWRRIASDLETSTNRQVVVSKETLRLWYGDGQRAQRRPAPAPQ